MSKTRLKTFNIEITAEGSDEPVNLEFKFAVDTRDSAEKAERKAKIAYAMMLDDFRGSAFPKSAKVSKATLID